MADEETTEMIFLFGTRNILNQKIWLEMFPFVLKASKCVWGKGAEFSSGLFVFIIGSLNSD